jgi:hypothetical protein
MQLHMVQRYILQLGKNNIIININYNYYKTVLKIKIQFVTEDL